VGPTGSHSVEGEGDPLGLGAFVECVYASVNIMEKLKGFPFAGSVKDFDIESRSSTLPLDQHRYHV
jgi:hypothetical protein